MQEPTEIYQRVSTFLSAIEGAKAAAKILGAQTAVHREGDLWIVLVPPGSAYLLGAMPVEDDSGSTFDLDPEPFTEDLSSDQDDWARSEEDGWFYED